MFNDLPDNKAIKMGDVFIVKLPQYYNSSYEINGVRSNGGLHTVPSLDCVLKVIQARKDLKHYVLGDEQLSVKEYREKSPHIYYDEDYEEYQFDSLEHEYEVKKEWERVKVATPVYEETPETLEPVEIELIGEQIDTGSKFISTPYQLGKAFFNKEGGLFSLSKFSIASDEVKVVRNEFKEANIDIPTHSGLEYVKVNGSYVFTNAPSYIKRSCYPSVLTSLQDAKDIEEAVRREVRSLMLVAIKPTVASDTTIKDILDMLSGLERSIKSIDVKQKSAISKSALLTTLSKKMEELRMSLLK